MISRCILGGTMRIPVDCRNWTELASSTPSLGPPSTNNNNSLIQDQVNPASQLNDFQIIKAVVLVIVTVVIMISVCKMVFQLLVKHAVRSDA